MQTEKQAMTVDQMLERYPKSVVEDVIFNRDYMKFRNAAIERLRRQIDEGIHVESCKRGIRKIEFEDLPAPPIDPDEPRNLKPDTLWRIIMLKYAYRDCPVAMGNDEMDIESVHPEELKNVNAILDAYRSGKLVG